MLLMMIEYVIIVYQICKVVIVLSVKFAVVSGLASLCRLGRSDT
ncbi:hypothetical protein MtrunA17_Chr8g0359591 [Medicago truncatula]|uniref:Transmembrane protein n=1 Tax=Medicago truncatula TaxID=3880 RepID=A0A396GI79_MEDTR|nr:hypothetical protein MtrunA17_Chr8g0359591 [Medicago truncatula]